MSENIINLKDPLEDLPTPATYIGELADLLVAKDDKYIYLLEYEFEDIYGDRIDSSDLTIGQEVFVSDCTLVIPIEDLIKFITNLTK